MKTVYCSFDGRYSDNPRALYRSLSRRGDHDSHVWLYHPKHGAGFPAGVAKVPYGSAAALDALESADLVVANTHLELEWAKKPGATYLQTWHGTPLKRIHYDVLFAPAGRLARLDADVARWDYLLSPNQVSTERLRSAFRFTGQVLETGYPRNDILSSPRRRAVRARVRASLGIDDDTTAVLYAPTWRDDEYFADGAPDIELALDVDRFVSELGDGYRLLPRLHYMMTERMAPVQRQGVTDVSSYPDSQELYLAADVLVTDYSSVMFDFAVTGKPIIHFAYDLERFRDTVRGFYFDLEQVAPGPIVRSTDGVLDALHRLPEVTAAHAQRYAEFRRTFTALEDGHASDRLAWLADQPSSERELAASID